MQQLQKFTTCNYTNGYKARIILWYFFNYFILNSSIPWPYSFKRWLLRLFGCKIGKGVIIKCRVRIKNAWRLSIGDHCWIGEDVWIDNLENVNIGNNVCISQGAMLLTGNHDFTRINFPYKLASISIGDGVWIGAKSIVCPGVICGEHSILTVNSVATKEMEKSKIYRGNPAQIIKERLFI